MTRQYHEERHRIKGVHDISQSCFYNIIAESAFTLKEYIKIEVYRYVVYLLKIKMLIC